MGRNIITLDDLTTNNLGVLKKINEVSLPAKYSDTWYQSSFDGDHVVQLAFYSELPVGAIQGKLFNSTHDVRTFEAAASVSNSIPDSMYIETLAVLEAYRQKGIATELLNWLIAQTKERFVHKIILHTQANNKKVIDWYLKRGFKLSDEVIPDYYKQQGLSDPDAVLLTLTV